VYDLVVEGESKPIRVTGGHPFWSEDRQDWVAVKELRIGERLRGRTGRPRVLALSLRAEPEPVYNIEVDGDHCYRVGQQGLLVHNASAPDPCADPTQKQGYQRKKVKVKDRRPGRRFGQMIDIEVVETLIKQITKSDLDTGSDTTDASQAWAQCVAGLPGDDAGHVLGNQLGGSGRVDGMNLYPQNLSENRGLQRAREDWVYGEVNAGKCVCVKITLRYDPIGFNVQTHPARPTKVIYEVWVNGMHSQQEWQNRPLPEPANPRCPRT
jgi:hypothetical protein